MPRSLQAGCKYLPMNKKLFAHFALRRRRAAFGACLAASLLAAGARGPLCRAARAQSARAQSAELERSFASPPEGARPWVYWYFMDGNVTREGLHADLEAMKAAGIGGAIYLEVGIGIPRGPVAFMSPEWQRLFAYAVGEAKRLGLQIALGSGPGWAGSGGPWVEPGSSMQHLVSSEVSAVGPARFEAVLPRPQPRAPFFGEGTLTPELRQKWLGFYRDEAVLAFPSPEGNARLADADHKALYYRAPYSSTPGTPPRLDAPADFDSTPATQAIAAGKVVVLTDKLGTDGRLSWDVPPGKWTIMRFGRTSTGQTSRPAPAPGLGFESDKFSRAALDGHLEAYTGVLFKQLGPNFRDAGGGLTMLHFDSWEMGSQNWSPGFRAEFIKRRGYDPLPLLPAMTGYIVGSVERSERFLWDLRQTASELVIENHAQRLKEYAHQHGMTFSLEPYDMNPAGDLDLGAVADLPMGEFWSRGYGFESEFSCFEAVSVGHTNGRRVIGAESFTADSRDAWLQHPASMKAQLDWALCAGINKFVIHRFQHQPEEGKLPGMTMGPYGVHWERTQTWWDMVPAFHKYMARASEMLRQGLPVADILYLTPEGAPQVFTPPSDALTSGLPDRKGYSFDGCSPRTLIERAAVRSNRIVFPDGMSYRVLVLPQWETMTPQLLRKITQLAQDGATIVGSPPRKSPSLSNFPACDAQVRGLAARLWGQQPARKFGKGRVLRAVAEPGTPLNDARWIWFAEGNPAGSAPVATRYFRTRIEVEPGRAVRSAMASMTADNSFELFVNGHSAGSGDDFHQAQAIDIARWLVPGANEIRVTAANTGEAPNPAGLIGSIRVAYADGGAKAWSTSTSWSAAQSFDGPWSAALELGAPGMGPWNLAAQKPPLYQSYAATASLLRGMGVAPDFSAGAPLRSIHRRLSEGDLYFVANTQAQPVETVATFRASGHQPEWWNPLSGERRGLTSYASANGLTRLPLRLGAYESGFVVFAKPRPKHLAAQPNFPPFQTLLTLAGPWAVAFDPRWGGPPSITFPTLDDWSQRPEDGIKYYSGKAMYATAFDAPARAQLSTTRCSLSLGSVKNLASVRLNGHELGVLWCEPWRVAIPNGLLKPSGNRLEVTVANLWVNRLIGDAGKPPEQQLTSTTFRPFKPNSPLQPSGLLGPVVLQAGG